MSHCGEQKINELILMNVCKRGNKQRTNGVLNVENKKKRFAKHRKKETVSQMQKERKKVRNSTLNIKRKEETVY